MPIARDESLTPPHWPNGHRNKGGYGPPEIIFDDNFDKGFGNWRNHQGGNQIDSPISRTALRAFNGSSKSLMLSTGARPANGTIKSGSCSTYNNMSRWVNGGLVKFETWLTLGGADLDNSPHNFMIGIDTQQWDDKGRGFYRLMCRRFRGGDPDTTRSNYWALTGDAPNPGIFEIPAQGSNPVPPYPGDNENKMNWFYVSMTVDLDHVNPDGGLGRYHEVEIGPYKYDVRNLGAGRGKQSPQMNSSVGAGPFTGGLNFGLGLGNRSVVTAAGPSWLLVGRTRGLWYPKA